MVRIVKLEEISKEKCALSEENNENDMLEEDKCI